ncbi:MAG TPA: TrbC/VirB2 family protein [Vicinamibacterales bacterium]|nr:TrbC/VirB2 family protein [Vicinamibacterales bacterium]
MPIRPSLESPPGSQRLRFTPGGPARRSAWWRPVLVAVAGIVLVPTASYAQASPWENAVNVLMTSFTGPIARGLSLVSIVVGGVTFAFGEGGSKRLLAGIVFGVGMAIGAVNFMTWLFP